MWNEASEWANGGHRGREAAGEVGRDETPRAPADRVKSVGLGPKRDGKQARGSSSAAAD